MNYSDIEHASNMINGCESLISGNKTPDATYAFAVLKLHASDAGFIDGQEGFLDAVKAGAKKGKEWLIKLIQYIKDFIKGISRDDRERIKTIDELSKKIKWEEHDFNTQTFQYSGPIGRIKALTNDANVLADLEAAIDGIDKKNVHEFVGKLSRASNRLKDHVETLNKEVERETNKLGKDDKIPKELSDKAKDLKNNSEAANILSILVGKVYNDMTKYYESWHAQHKSNRARQEDLDKEKANLEKGRNK